MGNLYCVVEHDADNKSVTVRARRGARGIVLPVEAHATLGVSLWAAERYWRMRGRRDVFGQDMVRDHRLESKARPYVARVRCRTY